MPSEDPDRIAVLQGTLDLIVLRTLETMGPQHAYAIATRLQQVSEDLLHLNQGTLIELFPDWPDETFPLYALYPSRHLPPARLRAFIEFILDVTKT